MLSIMMTGCTKTTDSGETSNESVSAIDQNETASTQISQESTEVSDEEDYSNITIGFCSYDNAYTFFTDMTGMFNYLAKKYGFNGIVVDAQGDITKQNDQISDLIYGKNCDAILCSAVDPDGILTSVDDCVSAGIPYIACDNPPKGYADADSPVYAAISSDCHAIGAKAAEYAVQLLTEKYGEPKGNVIIHTYDVSNPTIERTEGFKNAIAKYDNIKILEVISPSNATVELSMTLWEDMLQKYGEDSFDLVFCTNSTTCLGTIAAGHSANRNDYYIVGVDDDPDMWAELNTEGTNFKGTVVQWPTKMVEICVELALAEATGKDARNGERVIYSDIELVTQENYAEYQVKYNDVQTMIGQEGDCVDY
jgi:ABC-type sugar transport system substrate-binding protein